MKFSRLSIHYNIKNRLLDHNVQKNINFSLQFMKIYRRILIKIKI